jgi:hypothetical protein
MSRPTGIIEATCQGTIAWRDSGPRADSVDGEVLDGAARPRSSSNWRAILTTGGFDRVGARLMNKWLAAGERRVIDDPGASGRRRIRMGADVVLALRTDGRPVAPERGPATP